MQVTTIGLDLAKNIFQVHGITEDEKVAFNRHLRRAQLLLFFSRIEPCLIGSLGRLACRGLATDETPGRAPRSRSANGFG
jgi:hypothetical protein